jgi:hypothetical protein
VPGPGSSAGAIRRNADLNILKQAAFAALKMLGPA